MSEEILWTSGFFNERFPAPVSPLGWSLLQPLIEELALRDPLRFLGYPQAETIPLTRLWRGHPYANVRAFQIFYKVFPDFILPEDASRYFPNGDVSLRQRAPYPCWVDAPRFVFSLLRAFFSDPFNVSPLNNYRHWARYVREHNRRIEALRARLDELRHAASHEIFSALHQAENIHRACLRIHRWSLMDADLTFGLLKRWVGHETAARLVADVPNKTMQVDSDLRRLPMEQFLAQHGHRSFSLDIAVPTFAEEPAQIARLGRTTKDEGRGTEDKGRATKDEGRRTEDEGRRTDDESFVVRPSSWVKRATFDAVLSLARHYLALREDQRYYWQKALAVSRHLYLMLADRLVADGVMNERNAVFYATHQELADYFGNKLPKNDLAQKIIARQSEWRVYAHEFEQSPTESYPPFLRGDVPVFNLGATPAVAQWRGRAVSPGIARGRVRVVQSADELARVQPGEIMIAPATDPAWTPVFTRIAGLVVERGGVLSHSAVIAREYRIPAVAGIANIVNEMHDGEMIEVDGTQGVVRYVQA